MKITLQNGVGVRKEVKVGFSWTVLFFGCFVPLIRGDWKWLAIQMFMGLCTYGISHLVFAFIYNKIYIKELLNKGYQPATEQGREVLVRKGILSR